MVSDIPSYIGYWRNKLKRKLEDKNEGETRNTECNERPFTIRSMLAEYTTCLRMKIEEGAPVSKDVDVVKCNSKSKHKDFFLLSDELTEDKVT